MPFQQPFHSYWNRLIAPLLESFGISAVRADSVYTPTVVMDDVWKGIRDATFLIAELTGRNPNVLYELGLAHARGKPVILLADSGKEAPFDLKGIRVITHKRSNPNWRAVLQHELTKALVAIVGDPLGAIPQTFLAVHNDTFLTFKTRHEALRHCITLAKTARIIKNTVMRRGARVTVDIYTPVYRRWQSAKVAAIRRSDQPAEVHELVSKDLAKKDPQRGFMRKLNGHPAYRYREINERYSVVLNMTIFQFEGDRKEIVFGWDFVGGSKAYASCYATQNVDVVGHFEDYFDKIFNQGKRNGREKAAGGKKRRQR